MKVEIKKLQTDISNMKSVEIELSEKDKEIQSMKQKYDEMSGRHQSWITLIGLDFHGGLVSLCVCVFSLFIACLLPKYFRSFWTRCLRLNYFFFAFFCCFSLPLAVVIFFSSAIPISIASSLFSVSNDISIGCILIGITA